ncbi:MAG: selenium cofactor biosynthesis protein YqeC [Eubacteriales bacterium]|nr:selenium cofactor biosynthesis protein YqeC [Eubacteriales bacterium]
MSPFDTLCLTDAHSIAICGAGGKTTLLYALAEQARQQGKRVLVTTSTHIMQPENTDTLHFYEENTLDSFENVCTSGQISVIGTPCGQKKITGISPMMVDTAMQSCDIFLYEADGSKCLPIKCHNATEPVIWFGTDAVICVLGLSALGKPAQEICHRWQLDPLFSIYPDKILDTDDLIRLALECRRAAGYPHKFVLCLNQCDTAELRQAAQMIADGLAVHGIPCVASCFCGKAPEIIAL